MTQCIMMYFATLHWNDFGNIDNSYCVTGHLQMMLILLISHQLATMTTLLNNNFSQIV